MERDGRKMIYPLTFAQQVKYFPFKFYWKHMPGFKEILYAAVLSAPIYWYISKAINSPANVKNYEKYLENEEKERQAHFRHLEGYYEDQHKH